MRLSLKARTGAYAALAVVAVFARENGEGMAFEPEKAGEAPNTEETPPAKPPRKKGPNLTLVT